MKNIHVLPTDKPSRLQINTCFDNVLELWDEIDIPKSKQDKCIQCHHIYITSAEEIKKGDWYIADNKLYKASVDHMPELYTYPCKKIILTTDQDLIADGVEVIDDEFLKWFVKNPSCEFVKVEPVYYAPGYHLDIPQEEPKQFKDQFEFESQVINKVWDEDELKQETLEEAAENYTIDFATMSAFKLGAKWQADRGYSEEEVKELVNKLVRDCYFMQEPNQDVAEWFEQHKKK